MPNHQRMTPPEDVAAEPSAPGGALVTGGGRGLGLEIARRLVARGYLVHVTDLDADRAARAAAELGPRAFGRDRRYPIVNGFRDRVTR